MISFCISCASIVYHVMCLKISQVGGCENGTKRVSIVVERFLLLEAW